MLLGPLTLGLVLLVDPWAKNVDFSGGAAFELRGGIAPPQPSEASEPTLWVNVGPRAMMTYQDRVRGRQVSLEYSPSLYLRLSERYAELSDLPTGRPLQFHRATLRYAGDLNRRWSWQGSAGGSIGEQDYSLQSGGLVQGDGAEVTDGASDVEATQAGLVDDAIIFTGGVSAGASATVQLTPVHSLTFGPSVTVQRLLGEPPEGSTLNFDQTSYELGVSHSWLASRTDTVGTSLAGGFADFGANGSQAYGSGTLSWRRRLRPRLDSELRGGVFVTQQLETPAEAATQSARALPLMPTGNAILIGRVLERARLRITTDINFGSQAYFDPVQGSVLPLSGGGAGVTFHMPPDVTAGAVVSFYTPPIAPTELEQRRAANPSTARTTLSVRTPVTYVIDDHAVMEVGTIVTARGPNLLAGLPDPDQEYSFIVDPDTMMDTADRHTIESVPFDEIMFDSWRFTQAEVWLYVSFALDYSSSRSP